MSMFEAQLWCLAAGAIGIILGWLIAWWIAYKVGYQAAQEAHIEDLLRLKKTAWEAKNRVKEHYQPKPMRDKKGRFISPAKAKQESMTAQLKREVAAKKGRLL